MINEEEIIEFIDGCSVLVVIVSYQTGKLTIDALESITMELPTLPDMRVVIVDNTCGNDAEIINSAIIENHWSNWAKVVISPRNGGFAFGNNIAIKAAVKAEIVPDYIWLLNPDTRITADAGTSLVKFLDDNDEVGIIGSSLFHGDGTEWSEAFRFPSILGEFEHAVKFGPISKLLKNYSVAFKMNDEACQVSWVSGASMMIRSSLFKTVRFFDEEYFLYYEETDFCFDALSKGWTTWYVPSSKVIHISGQSTGVNGIGNSPKRLPHYMFESRYRYFRKNHGLIYATFADIARIIGLICNKAISVLRGRSNNHPHYLLRDSLRHFTFFKIIMRTLKN